MSNTNGNNGGVQPSENDKLSLRAKEMASIVADDLSSSDIKVSSIRLVQKSSEDGEHAGKIALDLGEGNEYFDALDIAVLKITKAYFVWNENGDVVASFDEKTAMSSTDIEGRVGKMVYVPDPSCDVVFTYIYYVIAYHNGEGYPCTIYMRKTNLTCAKKINGFIKNDGSLFFTISTEKKVHGKNTWYVFDAERGTPTQEQLEMVTESLSTIDRGTGSVGSLPAETQSNTDDGDIPF